MERPTIFSGFELTAPRLPGNARVLRPPPALPGIADFRSAVQQALEAPLDGEPVAALLRRKKKRVTVVIDDFSLPVPPLAHDCRRQMFEVLTQLLAECGYPHDRVTVLVANGLSRKWQPAELMERLGPAAGRYPVSCHDAERIAEVVRLGEEPEAPLELAGAVVQADVVFYLNVVTTPLHAGLFGLVSGLMPYRTARWLNAPRVFDEDRSPLVPGSLYHRGHQRLANLLVERTHVVQVSAVLNNELWAPALGSLIRSGEGLSRPLQMWNALPAGVRHRAARLLRAAYQPMGVICGSPRAVEPRALEAYYRQNEVEVKGQADVLVFGVPDQGPASAGASQNPVLAANLALGYLANLHTGAPVLREGGVLIFANPLQREFDLRVHAPHHELYEKVLRVERSAQAIYERFEPTFARRDDFIDAYQNRCAFHPGHALGSWFACASARRRAGRVMVANGDPRACVRLGFTPAPDVEEALAKARELLGTAEPATSVLELPPPFWVRVR